MMLLRHIPFLKTVFIYSFTAFGGPQGHLGMMVKAFVQKRKDLTEEELLEYNSFCAMLPGPTSTQTVTLIALKRGGIPLALITLCLWVFPAALIMGALSFVIIYFDTGAEQAHRLIPPNLFTYIQPMSVGFVFFAAAKMMRSSIKYIATTSIMLGSLLATLFIHSPWVFPGVLLISGTISNFSNNRIPTPQDKPKKINWNNLWLFVLLFIVAVILSLVSKENGWPHAELYHLFENFYRFGAIVFGGGQALMAYMLYQFVSRPQSHVLEAGQLLTGFGLVQAVPGPVFSVCSFVGGMAMRQYGPMWQAIGCMVATVAVFLPSTLLLFFLFPIYENLKHHVIIFRALEGINAGIVGIIIASGIILFQTIAFDNKSLAFEWTNLVVVIITFCLLYFTKIPAPLIVLAWLLMGWAM
jgi:chromate transporter